MSAISRVVKTAAASRARPRDTIAVVAYVVLGAGLFLVALQLIVLVVASLNRGGQLGRLQPTLANFADVLHRPQFLGVLSNTLILGTGSVLVMLLVAVPLVWLYTRTDLPRKDLLVHLLTVKIAVPSFLVAIAYVFLLNPSNGLVNQWLKSALGLRASPLDVYTFRWMIVLQGFALISSAFFMLVPIFRAIDGALEEAANASGVGKWLTAARVTIPLAWPGIVATGVYYFIVAIEAFDFPGILGLPVRRLFFSTWIYLFVNPPSTTPDYGAASATGVVMAVLGGLLMVVYFRSLKRAERYAVIHGKARAHSLVALSRTTANVAWALIGLYMFVDFVLPILMLLWASVTPFLEAPSAAALRSLSLRHYMVSFQESGPLFENTLIMLLVVPTIAVLIGLCSSWVMVRARRVLRQVVDLSMMSAVAVPSVVGALAFLYFGLGIYRLVPLYDTIWLVILGMGARYMTWAMRSIYGSMIQISRDLHEACAASGVPAGRGLLHVIFPLTLPAVMFSWFWVGMLSLRDLTIPVLLTGENSQVLASAIWGFQSTGDSGLAAAMAVQLVAMIGVLVFFFNRLARRVLFAGPGEGAG